MPPYKQVGSIFPLRWVLWENIQDELESKGWGVFPSVVPQVNAKTYSPLEDLFVRIHWEIHSEAISSILE